jgi:hypothetical protein
LGLLRWKQRRLAPNGAPNGAPSLPIDEGNDEGDQLHDDRVYRDWTTQTYRGDNYLSCLSMVQDRNRNRISSCIATCARVSVNPHNDTSRRVNARHPKRSNWRRREAYAST